MLRWLLLLSLLLGCSSSKHDDAVVVVSVKHDASLALTRIRYGVYSEQANPARDAPYELHDAEGSERDRPFVIEQDREPRFLLVVQGFSDGDARPRVEHRVRAAFESGRTIALRLYLSEACRDRACDSAPEQTCYFEPRGGVQAGSCGPIPGPYPLTPVTVPGEEDDWTPVTWKVPANEDAGLVIPLDAAQPLDARVPEPPDAASCDKPDGAICNPAAQCGCNADQRCLLRTVTDISCAAIPAAPLLEGQACTRSMDCDVGLSCRFGSCRKQCAQDADCAGGICDRFFLGFGSCFTACGNPGEPACTGAQSCTPLRYGSLARSYCAIPEDPCGYQADGECDEPLIGSGLCVADSDADDCCVADLNQRCDLVAQCGCGAKACAVNGVVGQKPKLDCLPVGKGSEGDLCTTTLDCKRGLGCFSGSCKQHCNVAADCRSKLCIPISTADGVVENASVCMVSCDLATGAPCQGPSVCQHFQEGDVCAFATD